MKLPSYVITLLATLVFVILFFEKSLGLNVAMYGVSTLVLLVVFKTSLFKNLLPKVVGLGLLLTAIVYYLYASPFTLFMVIVSFVLLIGLHSLVPIRSLVYAVPNSFSNYFGAFGDFFKSLKLRKVSSKSSGFGKLVRIIFLPIFVILLFLALYSMGSTYFSDAVGRVCEMIADFVSIFTNYINIVAVFVAIVGFFFGVIHSLQLRSSSFSTLDAEHLDFLTRTKEKIRRSFRNLDLQIEYKSAVFLLSSLCVLLIGLLYLEIVNVWIGFQWEGELLKEMVHEGTYILIIAIIISIGLTIYYFRKNLNFYKRNKMLKTIAYTWIALNGLLVVSVFIRNMYYIQYFGLAYKRIGVLFFLLLCIIGLVSLARKISDKRSIYYLVRVNALAAYITLVATCLVNWDSMIAQYNFSHYKTAFIHLPFMSSLSDKTLPYLSITDDQIAEIESKQVEQIPFAREGYFRDVEYKNTIEVRIRKFKKRTADRHWLESVWAEDRAYEQLK
jgi:hypothetical protein